MPAQPRWTIAIHGGAGALPSNADKDYVAAKIAGLQRALTQGVGLLKRGLPAIDVVERVVKIFEDDPMFNAGRGSVLDYHGNVSMDASIMDGRDLSCGAVANVTQVRNPVKLARYVREHTPHVLLSGSQADALAIQAGIEVKNREYFLTDEQHQKWLRWMERELAKRKQSQNTSHLPPSEDATINRDQSPNPDNKEEGDDGLFRLSTVGCVAFDIHGDLAAATSTGGLIGKQYGRIGDSPIIGAGTYAKNKVAAISCTGVGELFIKHCVASTIAAHIELAGEDLVTAMNALISKTLPQNSGGAIGVDAHGNAHFVFNTPVMARGRADAAGTFEVAID